MARAGGYTLAAVLLSLLLLARTPAGELEYGPLESTRILDRRGRLIYELRAERGGYGHWVGLESVSPHLVAATLAGEDARFFGHFGIDPVGIARAIWLNVKAGALSYGGSTITQQLAKLLDPRPRTLWGKLREACDAVLLERTLEKKEILAQYLNRAYYGRNAYGVEAASRRFFGKPARALRLDEAALLAILPRSPSAYDPGKHPGRAWRRRAHVLALMVERGFLPSAAAARAAREPIRLVDPARGREAPHVVDHLTSRQVLPLGAAEVRTTIDLTLQHRLEERARAHLREVGSRGALQAGVVVIENTTGDVLAMVGSRRYGEDAVDGSVNAVTALRHPGSTLKPFVYALAIEDGAHPGSPVLDVPTVWRGYEPRDLSDRYLGVIPFREALGSSVNVSAVRLTGQLGADRVARLLHDAGLPSIRVSPGEYGLPLSLGAAPVRLLDLANAYATLARGGVRVEHRMVGPGRPAPRGRRVLAAPTAYLVARMLADPAARRREFGVETPLELPFEAAVKTGTSEGYADDVVVGFTPEITVGVWTGSFDGRGMNGLLAMEGAAPLWRDAMLAAMEGRPLRSFERPAGVGVERVCPLSGMRRGAHCPHERIEEVAIAHRPAQSCTWHRAGGTALPAEVRAWQPDPAGGTADGSAGSPVEILGPADGARLLVDPVLPRSRQRALFRVAVRALGVSEVRWEVDGRLLAEVGPPFSAWWPIEPGHHTVRVVAVGWDRLENEIEIDVGNEGES